MNPTSPNAPATALPCPFGDPSPVRRLVAIATLVTVSFAVAVFVSAAWLPARPVTSVLAAVFFMIGVGWITLAFFTAIAGFASLRRMTAPVCRPEDATPGRGRIAVTIAVCNEDPEHVSANIEAMYDSLNTIPCADRFDFFVLSDTTDPDTWVAEEVIWHRLCHRLDAGGRLFYRKRRGNPGRKAGNIADFCSRWGRQYTYMVVLDADSIMDGRTLAIMAATMDTNPRLALLQTAPAVVNRHTLFGRLLQFAGATYGRVFAAGLSALSGVEGNYWGHNAIIRTDAFTRHCGLPELRGRAPLGGEVMSHDFVEAALLVRAGWQVTLDPRIGGSFEECPPTVAAFVRRDRRWCQGNLQHLKVLGCPGLRWMSRFHLATGILSYLVAPAWLGLVAVGLYHAAGTEAGTERAMGAEGIATAFTSPSLLILVGMLLIVPRLLGVADAWLLHRRGRVGTVLSAPLEILITAFLAPILMVHQGAAVISVLAGRSVHWTSQQRDEAGMRLTDLTRMSLAPMALGAAALAVLSWPSSQGSAWLWAVALLFLASPLLIAVMGSRSVGRRLRSLGLFGCETESTLPGVVARAVALRAETRNDLSLRNADGLRRVLDDPTTNAVHRAMLQLTGEAPGNVDGRALASARDRLRCGRPLHVSEKLLLLYDEMTVAAHPRGPS